MDIGTLVRLKAPFNATFTGMYEIIALAVAEDTYTVDLHGDGVGSDFHISHLEVL